MEQIASYSGHSDWSKYYKQAVQTLNRTKHSRTKVAPAELDHNPKLAGKVFLRKFGRYVKNPWNHIGPEERAKFPIGTKVCISMLKTGFVKGTKPSFSSEVFEVTEIRGTHPTTYNLKDSAGEPVSSFFYQWELQKAESNWKKHRRIQKIYRRNKREKTAEVGWRDYPQDPAYRTWISEAALKDYRQSFQ